ncbi:hypothetical protein R1flu_015970 [Riccia fluitans]|uniref:Uncharacterized protein n=1 Tax=Riccia fluitans TaxID=41844 RepID=A0ABD1YNM6_9MARC
MKCSLGTAQDIYPSKPAIVINEDKKVSTSSKAVYRFPHLRARANILVDVFNSSTTHCRLSKITTAPESDYYSPRAPMPNDHVEATVEVALCKLPHQCIYDLLNDLSDPGFMNVLGMQDVSFCS